MCSLEELDKIPIHSILSLENTPISQQIHLHDRIKFERNKLESFPKTTGGFLGRRHYILNKILNNPELVKNQKIFERHPSDLEALEKISKIFYKNYIPYAKYIGDPWTDMYFITAISILHAKRTNNKTQ